MLSVLLIWIYIFITTFLIGKAFLVLFFKGRVASTVKLFSVEDFSFFGLLIATVYAEYFSLFAGVGLAANIILVILTVLSFVYLVKKGNLKSGAGRDTGIIWICVCAVVIVVMAYGCSRGYFHEDSNLYHGQSIHWIESYGVVRGIANLHARLGYNSSSFCTSALYSFSFLGGQSFHAVQGFAAVLLMIKCLRISHVFKDRKLMISDFAKIGALYYVFNIYSEMVSPASDYYTMIAFVYSILKAVEIYEGLHLYKETCADSPDASADIAGYEEAFLYPAMTAAFTPTLKLSAAPVVLLVLIPVFLLLRKKRIKRFLVLALSCAVIVVPFFVRNYLISGLLFYPSMAFDVFHPAWRIPTEVATIDAGNIIAYGRGYTNFQAADYSFMQWFPHWFGTLKRTEILFMVLGAGSILLFPVSIILRKGFKLLHIAELSVIAAFLFWLFTAPLVRYGMGYILLLPTLMAGDLVEAIVDRFLSNESARKVVCRLFLAMFFGFLVYKGVSVANFVSRTYLRPNYILQQDYDRFECNEQKVGELTFYVPKYGALTGYDAFPSSPWIAGWVLPIGDSYADGFMPSFHD